MADPLHSRQSDSGGSVSGRSKGLSKILSKIRRPFSQTSWKNSKVLGQAPLDPLLEGISSSNHTLSFKRETDPVDTDYLDLLVKNKTLQTEVRNLQNRLLSKESSLKHMNFRLKHFKENSARQSSQILSLKDHIKELEEINASVNKITSVKTTCIENLEKSNRHLNERVLQLENHQRVQLIKRSKAEQKAASLQKKFMDTTQKLFMDLDMEGHDDPLDTLVKKDSKEAILMKNLERENNFLLESLKDGQKGWDRCQHKMLYKEKQISKTDQIPFTFTWKAKTLQTQFQSFINQLATLLSNSHITVAATEEDVRERIQEISTNEQSWIYKTDILQQKLQLLTQQFEHVHQLYEEAVCDSSQAEERLLEQKKSLKLSEGKIVNKDFFQEE